MLRLTVIDTDSRMHDFEKGEYTHSGRTLKVPDKHWAPSGLGHPEMAVKTADEKITTYRVLGFKRLTSRMRMRLGVVSKTEETGGSWP